jgi:hypothetical protein
VGIALVVFGFAAVDGFHVEGVSQDAGYPLLGAKVGQPVPGEHAFDADHESLSRGRHGLEERFGGRLQMAMPQDLTGLIHDANVDGAGVPVNATGELLWLGGESPEVSSS